MKDNLNPQQARYVQYYIESGNMTESALKAGYSETSAKNASNFLMKNPLIREKILEYESFVQKSCGWHKHRLVSEIEGVFQQALADQQLTVALKALELIGKCINVTPSTKTMEVKHTFESLLDQSTTPKNITPQPPEITIN
tara:strand:- start:48 stop:470 length:423 start_codon:yes stop_codon:yes gene_type:complete